MLRMQARFVLTVAMLVVVGLAGQGTAAATPPAQPAAAHTVDGTGGSAPDQQQRQREAARVPPIVGWLVVVAVRGGVQAIKVGVRSRTARAAREAAKGVARNWGYEVISTGGPIKGDYRTAGGFQIRVNQDPRRANGYPSFNAFKNRWGVAGESREWHHIVEQKARTAADGRFPSWQINNRQNLVNIRKGLHQKCINALMATRLKNMIKRDRQALRIRVVRANRDHTLRFTQRGYSYNNQHLFGLRLLKHCGVRISGSGI